MIYIFRKFDWEYTSLKEYPKSTEHWLVFVTIGCITTRPGVSGCLPDCKISPCNSTISSEPYLATFDEITLVESIKYNLRRPKNGPDMAQYVLIHVTIHFLLLSWQCYSVKIWIILEISKQRYGINGHNIFLIWAKYGPNILSIVIHYLYSICRAWLFSEILSL